MKENIRTLQPIQHRSLAQTVLDDLRRSIVNGQLLPGERLLEGGLADQLQVSRVTVRHALHQLQVEGLIDLRPRKGAIVTLMSDEVASEVCQVRAALEGLAAYIGCRAFTDAPVARLRRLALDMGECVRTGDIEALAGTDIEFHTTIFEGVPNPRLLQQWSVTNALHGALMASMLARHHLDAQGVIDLHLRLVDALSTREPREAEAGVREHYLGPDWERQYADG